MGNVSRRDFLRGAVGATAAITLSGAMASTTGCSNDSNTQSAEPSAWGSNGSGVTKTSKTHECDVLVIGGGIAGMEAALRVVAQGKSAIIVDKGVFGHSGNTGINWGHTLQSMEFSPESDETIAGTLTVMDMVCEGLLNQRYFFNLLKAQYEEKPIAAGLKYGSIPLYNEDGTVFSHNTIHSEFYPIGHDQGFWPRLMAQWCQRDGNVTEICENTMVVDILLSDEGEAAGAVAVNLVDGEPHIFRSKATIMATGSYCWICGWNGMGPESMDGKESTGDGMAIFLKHGIPIADMDQYCGDASQWTPAGVRQTMGNLNYDGGQLPNSMVFDGNMVSWEEILAEKGNPQLNMGKQIQIMYSGRLYGRATENGGIYIDKACQPEMPRYFRRREEEQKALLGYEMPQYVEVVPEPWDSAGSPRDLTEYSETTIPRLFFAGAGPGAFGGQTQIAAQSGGWLSANGAVQIADTKEIPKVSSDQINSIIEKAYEYFDRDIEDSIRPREVMRNIQLTYWDQEMGPIKDEARINEIITELERIKEEDLPRMTSADRSYRWNTEWRNCLEAESMLYCALGASHAGLIRQETRGFNLRTDYPRPDNSTGLANTVVSLSESGEWTAEMAPKFDDIVPADVISGLVTEDVGLDFFAE